MVAESDPELPFTTVDVLGGSVVSLGDVDGDGNLDVLAGIREAPTQDAVGFWLLEVQDGGAQAGEILAGTKIAPPSGSGATPSSIFGASFALLGDIDSDDEIEFAVGAPGEDSGAGAVYILRIDPTTMAVSYVGRISGADLSSGLAAGDAFGSALAGVPDLAAEKGSDLVVGAPGCDDGGTDRGSIWIIDLTTAGAVNGYRKVSHTQGAPSGMTIDGAFGSAVTMLGLEGQTGDVNGDGVTDIAVGAPEDGTGGSVWILFLERDHDVAAGTQIATSGTGGFWATLSSGDRFGAALAPLAANGSCARILAIGAPGTADWATGQGGVWYVCLSTGGTVTDELLVGPASGGFGGFLVGDDGFGSALATLGDLDGNGDLDVLAGKPGCATCSGSDEPFWGVFHGSAFAARTVAFGETNPGSLDVTSGSPTLGATLSFELDDPSSTVTAGTTLLYASALPVGNAPVGESLAGHSGLVLVDLATSSQTAGCSWSTGNPVTIQLTMPTDTSLVGTSVFVQGSIAGSSTAVLSNGQRLVLAP